MADESLSRAVFKLLEKHKIGNEEEVRGSGLRMGIREVTKSIRNKQAKLVVLAGDVDPIDIVLVFPTLCKKMGVPYVVVKGKKRLGRVVKRKNCSFIALTSVSKKDMSAVTAGIDSQMED